VKGEEIPCSLPSLDYRPIQ